MLKPNKNLEGLLSGEEMKRKEKINLRHFCSNRKSKGKHNSRMSTKTKKTISRLLC
jgi:hypothetical protein